MRSNFSSTVAIDGKKLRVTFVPQFRKDGLYWEVNVQHYPRFYMAWSAMGRYDIVGAEEKDIPYDLVLAASDILEKQR